MSPSTRSKPASPDSPRDGDAADVTATSHDDTAADGESPVSEAAEKPAADGAPARTVREKRRDKSDDDVAIELEVSRQRTIGWTAFGIVLGSLLIWKLGT